MVLKRQQLVEYEHRVVESQCAHLETMINQLCYGLPEIKVPTTVVPTSKLESLVVALKASRSEVAIVHVELEQKIEYLQMKL